jgi:hypothetical protein
MEDRSNVIKDFKNVQYFDSCVTCSAMAKASKMYLAVSYCV